MRLAYDVGETVTARFAPEKVERVLMNLLTNALRHTPGDGSVAVRVEPLGDEVRFAVEDTGDGLDAEARARMFERFWRGDPSRSVARVDTSASRSRAVSSRRTAAGSGPRAATAAAPGSACTLPAR